MTLYEIDINKSIYSIHQPNLDTIIAIEKYKIHEINLMKYE
jgi:hypothetical protein